MRRFAARPVWQSRLRTFLPMLPYALAAVLGSTDKKNVYGDELVTCSTDGMAMTGFTRDGFCTECADARD